jgi:hypothetical protein
MGGAVQRGDLRLAITDVGLLQGHHPLLLEACDLALPWLSGSVGALFESTEVLRIANAVGVLVRLHKCRRNRADDHRFGDSSLTVPCNIANHLAPAGRVPDVNGVLDYSD